MVNDIAKALHQSVEIGKDFKCGNSKFSDLEWDFNDVFDSNSQKSRRFIIDFKIFKDKPEILIVVKKFIISQLNENKFSTVKRNFDGLIRFMKFVNEEIPMLDSFSELDEELLREYFYYLLNAKSKTTNEYLSETAIKKAAFVIKEILILGSVRKWGVPVDTGFTQSLYEKIIINNQQLKKKAKNSLEKVKNKITDQELIDEILAVAIDDLNNNKNIIVTSAIIITSQLGLRLNELLDLEVNCIKLINKTKMLVYKTKKLEEEARTVRHPVNELVEFAINEMTKYSKDLREEAKDNKLFLIKNIYTKGSPIVQVSLDNFNKNYIRPWIEFHNITYKDGQPLDFTSHTFRHIFATYSLSGGASLSTISRLMNHKSIRGTEHYTHLLEEDIQERFIEVMSKGSILAGKKAPMMESRLKNDNPFKGKTMKQVDMIKKSMKIQELPHGLCLHHPMRNEPCEGDGVCLGCDNYITTPRFLDVHKSRLKRVRESLSNSSIEGPFKSKMKNIEVDLVELIDELERKIPNSRDWLPKKD